MNTHADKTLENKSKAASKNVVQKQGSEEHPTPFVDNRPEAIAQRKRQELVNNSPQVRQLSVIQTMINNNNNTTEALQKKENKTGLPNQLKSGVESLSGIAMDDVKVHYNSKQPAQLNAHAYAQGTNIHLGPGQEKHLPHEAWHVVQQKQGRVKPTMQMKEKVNINDDKGLEKEADVMGAKAAAGTKSVITQRKVIGIGTQPSTQVVQKYVIRGKHVYRNGHTFLRDAIPAILSALGSRAPLVLQAIQNLPGRAKFAMRKRLVLYLGDGKRRTFESVVKEGTAFLLSLAAGPHGVSATRHGVNPHSMNEDFNTPSSDHGPRNIARNVGTHDTPIPHYVSNPTVLSGNQALVRTHGQLSMHPSLRVSSPQREIMWLLTGSGNLLFGARPVNLRRPHPTMMGGEDPHVLSGGTLTMRGGRIAAIRDDSGHFQPGRGGVPSALGSFHRLPSSVFHPEFTGFRAFGMEEHTGFGRTQRAVMMLSGQKLFAASATLRNQMRERTQADNRIPERFLNANAIRTMAERHMGLLGEVEGLLMNIQHFVMMYSPHFRAELGPLVALVHAAINAARQCIAILRIMLQNPTIEMIRRIHPFFDLIERFLTAFQRTEGLLRNTSSVPSSSLGVDV